MFSFSGLVRKLTVGVAVAVSSTLISGAVGSNATIAAAAETRPSVSVSGKLCPKAGSSSEVRSMKISKKAKTKSRICFAKMNDGSHVVDLNAKATFTKANNFRFNANVTAPYAYAHFKSDDGLLEFSIDASTYSIQLRGQQTQYPDERGKAWFKNVPGKAFTLSVTWYVVETTRYWDNHQARFVTTRKAYYITERVVRVTKVTRVR